MDPVIRSNGHPYAARHRMSSPRWLAALVLFGLVALAPPVWAQTGTIRGTVTAEGTGQPLAGVQIFVEDTQQGTLTNASGAFLIPNVAAGVHQVRAQLIGYRTSTRSATVAADQAASVTFQLGQSAISLDEVVVTGAGQATQVKKLGNTVATIRTDALETAPVANVSEVLQGREPGVQALPTGGLAGEGTKIRIRGGASLSQSQEPIIYVDGVRIDNGGGMGGLDQGGGSPSRIDDINPAAIERIEILKGAAAATLYGTEAANGVIQIFTKAGSAGTPRWTFRAEQGVANYPVDRYKQHAGFARTPAQASELSAFWGQNITPYDVFEVDLFPSIFETGDFSDLSLSVNGGNDQVTYFVSGRYLGENGPFRNDGFGAAQGGLDLVDDQNIKRQANANIAFNPWDNVRVRANSMYIDGYLQVPDNNNNIYGTISTLVNSKPERANERNPSGAVPTFGSLREMMYRTTTQNTQRFAGSLETQYTAMTDLNLSLTFGVDMINEQNVRFVPFGWNVDGLSGATPDGTRTVRDVNQRQFTVDTKASWNTDVGSVWNSAFVVGAQAFVAETERSGGTGAQFPGPGLEVIEAGASQTVFEARVNSVTGGVFAQEQIGFNDYLFVTGGARYDKHSAFGETAGGAFYPKLSVSFVPSDMPGMSFGGDFLSQVRVRAAIGKSGLQPNAFAKFTTYAPLNSVSGSGVEPSNLGNDALKPETSTEIETGFDLGLFDNRMALTATYWDRTVSDVLIARQYAFSGGFPNPQLDNIGEMKAHGYEIGLNGTVFEAPRASLELFANGAYLKQTVTDMGDAPPLKPGYYRYGNWVREGYSPGSFFGPKLIDAEFPIDVDGNGQPDTREQLLAFYSQPRAVETIRTLLQPGIDGDPLLNYLGKPTPDWAGAFGGTLGFLQNFRLSTLFEYKAGLQVHNLTDEFRRSHGLIGRNIRESAELEAILLNPASSAEQRVEAARRWATEMSALSPQDRLNAIEDADFIRWRELSLSYRVPSTLIDRFGMRSLELTAAGRNIALWTGYSGVDPEINVTGGRNPGSDQEFNNFVTGVEGWGFAIPRRLTLAASIGF